jgi:hypothetical protein
MLQAAMEHVAVEFIGRSSYQRREADQAAYRNGYKARLPAKGRSNCTCRKRAPPSPSRHAC